MKSLDLIPQANQLFKVSLESIATVFANGAKIMGAKEHRISPHIKIVSTVIVENVAKKRDYAEDLKVLTKAGVSVKDAARALGISASYAYKLLKK